ncbi:hypothetical protein [Micromonospora chersina]|uniref:hypothetical protein n=1 Tax=Micromonospora chersina TaxID=47854 RepID=UPI0033BD9355
MGATAAEIPVGAIRRTVGRTLVALCAVLGVAGAVLQLIPPSPASAGVSALPEQVREAPRWTADIRHAPLDRALAVFDLSTSDGTYMAEDKNGELKFVRSFTPLTLVGPGNRYRIFDPADSDEPWTGAVELSPDGRYLMTGHGQHTQLLDVTTGRTRLLPAGAPLAWSSDGRHAVLAHFDGGEAAYPVTGQLRVVDMPSGVVRWSVPLEPGPLPRTVDAVLSQDGSTIVVQRHGDLYAYQRDRGVIWERSTRVDELAGHAAWSPYGTSVLAEDRMCMVMADTGQSGRCLRWGPGLSGLRDELEFYGIPDIVGWDGVLPIVRAGQGLVRLSDRAEVLVRVPRRTRVFQISAGGARSDTRQPGPPDLGPVIQRYRPIIRVGSLVAGGLTAVALALWFGRRHVRRSTARA